MSIRSKLTIMFLAIATIPLVLVSALTFHNYRNSLEIAHISNLRDITAFKADKIETYLDGLKADMEIAQSLYNIKNNLPVLSRLAHDPNNADYMAAKNLLDGQLQLTQSVLKLSDIMLANPQGKIVYSSNPQHYQKDLLTPDLGQKAFEEGKNKVYFSDVFFNKANDGKPSILVYAPAVDFNGVFIGVIAFEVDMAPIYKIVQDMTGLGTTGESVVGKRIGNEVLYLSPLKFEPNSALNKRITIGAKVAVPIQNAVQGKTGAAIAVDYRGRGVIGAWTYMPSLDWGLATKIDASEAFADEINLRNWAGIILIIVLALSGILAFSIAKSISEPIKKLSEGAVIVGSGNLDYKVGTDLNDEIGQLSRSFDKMTQDLKQTTASRDELNKEIAERKQAEEALKKTSKELARSNKDLEQFAYVASHDLQEPLRAVAGFVELLKLELQSALDEKTKEYMFFVVDGVSRMQELIRGLLEYSRIGIRGKTAAPTDAKAALDRAIAHLQLSIQESGAKITADPLPTVQVDSVQLIQLFQNLIGNAIKFRGKQPPVIHVSACRRDGAWQFSVADNGIGIEPQYAQRIFLIFQRLHTRDKYPGTGIGLAICNKIVERHGGKIWLESELGRGSTVYFTFPDKGGFS